MDADCPRSRNDKCSNFIMVNDSNAKVYVMA